MFWGWVWGIPGALIGIPLTTGIAVFCRHGKSTRWLAQLLEHRTDDEPAKPARGEAVPTGHSPAKPR